LDAYRWANDFVVTVAVEVGTMGRILDAVQKRYLKSRLHPLLVYVPGAKGGLLLIDQEGFHQYPSRFPLPLQTPF
jgi:hypothetical protein